MATLDRPDKPEDKQPDNVPEIDMESQLNAQKALAFRMMEVEMTDYINSNNYKKEDMLEMFLKMYRLSLVKDQFYLEEAAKRLGFVPKKGL